VTRYTPSGQSLDFELAFSGNRSARISLSKVPLRTMTDQFAQLIRKGAEPGGAIASPGVAQLERYIVSHFSNYLKEHFGFDDTSQLSDLRVEHVDGYDAYRHALNLAAFGQIMNRLRIVLERAHSAGWIDESLLRRLAYGTLRPSTPSKPRDSYSDFVLEQIINGAAADVTAAIERKVAGEQALQRGVDPAEGGWDNQDNVAWHVAHHGGLPYSHPLLKDHVVNREAYYAAVRLIYPSNQDALAYFVLVSLETELTVASVTGLKTDCLRVRRPRSASLAYVKLRSHAASEHICHVRAGSKFATANLIDGYMAYSVRLRQTTDVPFADKVFIYWSQRSGGGPFNDGKLHEASEYFCRRHDIRNDDGTPLRYLTPSMLRKSGRARRYMHHLGHLDKVATDHSKGTLARHYASIPYLLPLHQRTVAQGLTDALDNVHAIVVRANTEPSPNKNHGLPEDRDGGDAQDVWVASCQRFTNPPHGALNGDHCAIPVWGCLECSNAVISEANLPSILAFLRFLMAKRQEMPLARWSAICGRAYLLIYRDILPKFNREVLERAAHLSEEEPESNWLETSLAILVA
jgi:hypothetical protein